MRESLVASLSPAESFWLEWLRPAEDYFEFVVPEAFRAVPGP